MRRVIADEWMTLDGVIQAPGQANEDTAGGFQHGGWHVGYFDDLAQRWVVESIVKAGGFLLGRRTYEIFAAHWPNASEEEQVLAEPAQHQAQVRGVQDARRAAGVAELDGAPR